jgi:hypothetical protein
MSLVLFGNLLMEKHENVVEDEKDPETCFADAIHNRTNRNKADKEREDRANQKDSFPIYFHFKSLLPFTLHLEYFEFRASRFYLFFAFGAGFADAFFSANAACAAASLATGTRKGEQLT